MFLEPENIPDPKPALAFSCPFKYDDMKPVAGGRFCTHCQKTVVDLTGKTTEEILRIIQQEEEVCGKILGSQLKNLPHSRNPSPLKKIMLLAGAGLAFSGIYAQVGTLEPVPMDTVISLGVDEAPATNREEDVFVGTIVEKMPEYKYGGEQGMLTFLSKNLVCPANSPGGKVIVGFTVDETGKITDVHIKRSVSPELDAEVMRVVGLMEFTPGTQNGKPARVKYYLPVMIDVK